MSEWQGFKIEWRNRITDMVYEELFGSQERFVEVLTKYLLDPNVEVISMRVRDETAKLMWTHHEELP